METRCLPISMQTVHITSLAAIQPVTFNYTKPKMYTGKELIKELYDRYLTHDDFFHYVFEPDLIIRISDLDILKAVKSHLNAKNIRFVVYDYPQPVRSNQQTYYGEEKDGLVMQRLIDVYLPFFHINSISALTHDSADHFTYMKHIMNSMLNMLAVDKQHECETLMLTAVRKADQPLDMHLHVFGY